jgi:hypothetical protein
VPAQNVGTAIPRRLGCQPNDLAVVEAIVPKPLDRCAANKLLNRAGFAGGWLV